jgi:hypothetical protein
MEMPESGYLYTVAILGMTFIGFSAIVMLLRQTVGLKLRPFDALFAHVYMEFGLIISAGAMLPPLVSFWGADAPMVWQISSALVGAPLLLFGLTYPTRRRAASGERTPMYVQINVSIVILISLALLANAGGLWQGRGAAVFLSALTAFMIFAVATWLRALNLILIKKSR